MSIIHPSFGKLDDNRIIMFDTTLRDGEQAPGFSMNIPEKIRMAEALSKLGVDVIEAGFATASRGDFESVKAISESIGRRDDAPVIGSLARAARMDVLRAAEALRAAKRKRIHVVIATSALHMTHKLRMTPDAVIAASVEAVTLARQYVDDVQWSAEDATRSDIEFLCRCVEAVIRAGATTINLPDTVGYALPEDMWRMFTAIRERVPGSDKVVLSTHNHNDLGQAVANTLTALRTGVVQVESTINGIGERAGNAALEEVVMAIRTRNDIAPYANRIVTEQILCTSKLLANIAGFDVQPNKAIVGRNAFAHESGVHQDGVLKNAATYEIMTPESVGWNKSSLVMGKHSGRAAFRDKLEAMGYADISNNALDDAFRRFKDLADSNKVVYDDDIVALVDDGALRDHQWIKLVDIEIWASSKAKSRARVELEIDGAIRIAEEFGNGPVDATFNAIRALVSHEVELRLFSIGAVTERQDAQARCTVRLEYAGKLVDGRGSDTDTIVAAAAAYVHALSKLPVKSWRVEPVLSA